MRTVIRITNDYNSTDAHEQKIENISYLLEEGPKVFCEVGNSTYQNNVERLKTYHSDPSMFRKKTVFTARGYSQGDWQTFTLHHNCKEDNTYFSQLVDELKKSFTHMNDYQVEKFERTEINGKKFDADPHDYTGFSITHIEFPEDEDVLAAYIECFGKDFDEYEIDI